MSKEELPDGSTKAQPVRATRFSGRLEDEPTIRALLREARAFEPYPGIKAMAAVAGVLNENPTMKAVAAAMRGFEQSPAMKAMAAAASVFNENPTLQAAAAAVRAFEQSLTMQAMAAAASVFNENPTLKAATAAARAFEQSPTMKAMAAAASVFNENSTLKAAAAAMRAFEASPAMLELARVAKAWETNPATKALVDSAQDFNDHPRISALAESGIAPEQWGVTDPITLEAVFTELSSRAESATVVSTPSQGGEVESSLAVLDSYTGEVISYSPAKHPLLGVPTWVMLLWLWLFAPAVYVIVNWESARAGLADLNARLPQTETLAGVRKFIRKELAGKAGDFRIVTGSDVRLRVAPGMKSEVLLHLPKESIVVVLGKEDRTWLFVSYEHQGYMIDGYVSTTYLKKAN
ncbi:UNVERIFIED_CONTAM: SH3 domain-containing protein [Pseudomonas aeruginosa]